MVHHRLDLQDLKAHQDPKVCSSTDLRLRKGLFIPAVMLNRICNIIVVGPTGSRGPSGKPGPDCKGRITGFPGNPGCPGPDGKPGQTFTNIIMNFIF